jgi:hypothetical protein
MINVNKLNSKGINKMQNYIVSSQKKGKYILRYIFNIKYDANRIEPERS